MSRYDQPSEPDFDRYEAKPIDAQDEPQDGEPIAEAIDPREHAATTALMGLHDLEIMVLQCQDLETAFFLKKLAHQLWTVADRVDLKASQKIDDVMERQR